MFQELRDYLSVDRPNDADGLTSPEGSYAGGGDSLVPPAPDASLGSDSSTPQIIIVEHDDGADQDAEVFDAVIDEQLAGLDAATQEMLKEQLRTQHATRKVIISNFDDAPATAAAAPSRVIEEAPSTPKAAAEPATSQDALWLSKENLTFPAVTVVAGIILNFVLDSTNGPRVWWSLTIAVIFGGFLTYLGISDPKSPKTSRDRAIAVFVGLVNTVLLWITIWGVSSIGKAAG